MDELDVTDVNPQKMDKPKRIYQFGVYNFKCLGYKQSKNIPNYTSPSAFTVLTGIDTASGAELEVMLWHPKSTDSAERQKMNKEIIRKFFDNIGADAGVLKGTDVLDDCINKECKVAMKQMERVGTNRDGKPTIYNDAKYWYSGNLTKELTFNAAKALIPLSDEKRNKFLQDLQAYEAQHSGGVSTSPETTDTNLEEDPF